MSTGFWCIVQFVLKRTIQGSSAQTMLPFHSCYPLSLQVPPTVYSLCWPFMMGHVAQNCPYRLIAAVWGFRQRSFSIVPRCDRDWTWAFCLQNQGTTIPPLWKSISVSIYTLCRASWWNEMVKFWPAGRESYFECQLLQNKKTKPKHKEKRFSTGLSLTC